MIRSEKKLKEFAEILKKDKTLLIIEAIESLRLEQPFEGVISLLTAFYDQSDEFTVRKAISGFLNDLKDQSVCAEIIEEIRKAWKADTISMLVSSCWQSGLD
jgi:predicted DNA-binding protein